MGRGGVKLGGTVKTETRLGRETVEVNGLSEKIAIRKKSWRLRSTGKKGKGEKRKDGSPKNGHEVGGKRNTREM